MSIFIRILLSILPVFITFNFARAQQGAIGVELGLGFSSNYGNLGLGGRYQITDDIDVHITSGVDRTGSQVGMGARWYFSDIEHTCYFFWDCKYRNYLGGTLLRSPGGEITYSTDGVSGVYDLSSGFSVNSTVGSRALYKSFYSSVELGYRFWTTKPSASYKSGTFLQSQQDKLNDIKDSFSLAAVFGFLF